MKLILKTGKIIILGILILGGIGFMISQEMRDCGFRTNGWNILGQEETGFWGFSSPESKYIKIDGLYVWNFRCIGSQYSRNNTTVFYQGKALEGADSKTFEKIGSFYAKDKKHIYFRGKIISNDVESFSELGKNTGFGKDAESLYCNGKKIEGADVATFQVNEKKISGTGWRFQWEGSDKNKEYKCDIY